MLPSRCLQAKPKDTQCNCKTIVNRRSQLRCQASAGSAAAAAAAAAEPADVVQQLLTRRSYAPPRYVGPVQVSEVPGM
jgi:hypothetical protein